MDGDFRVNLEELLRKIDNAEVISIYFPLLRKTILVDTRFTMEDPPMVKVVPMASSGEDRHRALRRLRPSFPRPKTITVLPWPKYAESLVRLGVWQRVLQLFVHSGHKETVQACNLVLEEVYDLEREELAAVITGENYHTMWARAR
ncbi:hypothetical protein FIM08_02850 [SAR202 cluster bacterium AC-647-N09_OGT_505m]|nr:hypothetical protein [SAR202 cluster bacterium AC-647-N09_OGT_505m]